MKFHEVMYIGMIGASAAVTAGALAVAILQGSAGASSIAGDMETGVTITKTAAPSAVSVPVATPEIKGPAPLPPEEQGLPG